LVPKPVARSRCFSSLRKFSGVLTIFAYTKMGDEVRGVVPDDLENLRQWHEEYLVATIIGPGPHDVIRALDHDTVDHEQIEQQISLQASRLPDFDYFCDECRETFGHWPKFGETVCIRRSNTVALEAAARRGCRFCCFLLQVFIDEKSLLTFRRIDKRLKVLGKCEPFTVCSRWAEGEDKSYGIPSIHLPGRPELLNDPMMTCIGFNYLDPQGEQPRRMHHGFSWKANAFQLIHTNHQLTFSRPLLIGYASVIKATELVAYPWPTRCPLGSSGSRTRD
jgi:hypothetical protein